MDTRYLILLGLLVIQTIAQIDEEEEDRGPAPGNCVYRLDIPASSLQGSCMTERFQREMNEMKAEYSRISQENVELRTSIQEVVKDYEEMVDTVRTLKKDTESWRQVVQWPSYEELFKPEDISTKPMSSKKYVDCYQAHRRGETKQGIYLLEPEDSKNPFYGYCLEDGWTVIFRRFDGSEDFNKVWYEYSMGFGNITGEFFIGLENLYKLTETQPYSLKVEALGFNNKKYNAMYREFQVGPEQFDYPLLISNMSVGGDFTDDFALNDGFGFTTSDRDNDQWDGGNCAFHFGGGWWLNDCGSNPSSAYCEWTSCMNWGGNNVKKLVLSIRPSSAGYQVPAKRRRNQNGNNRNKANDAN